ncbi:MAG: metal-dependent transcriptional regulator [Bacteroidia bacterium]
MTIAEENYLKAIYKLTPKGDTAVSTNSIANQISTSAASVTDMIRKLAEKNMVVYEKYKGVKLTQSGAEKAKMMIRNHRLWEVFLVEKLNFGWDAIHEIAEELEHINSDELIDRLDDFLGKPKYDPHGDPIPDASGKITYRSKTLLSQISEGVECIVVGVDDTSSSFLQYLDKLQISLGTKIKLIDKIEFDGSAKLEYDGSVNSVSAMVTNNIYVKTND